METTTLFVEIFFAVIFARLAMAIFFDGIKWRGVWKAIRTPFVDRQRQSEQIANQAQTILGYMEKVKALESVNQELQAEIRRLEIVLKVKKKRK